jgi:tetraacyldisaccharide 4'-kinase
VSLRARTEQTLRRFWARAPGPGARLLLGAPALLVAALARRRRRRRARGRAVYRAPFPVLVVGNLTVGGSGKTPAVVWAAGEAARRGLRVGVAVRSYRGRIAAAVAVGEGSDPRLVGDEAVLLARRLPGVAVVAARDRVEAVRFLATTVRPDLVVADDGLQHPRLARDRVWLCVDGAYGFGNGRVLPLGPLREPDDPELFAAGTVVLVKEDPAFSARPPGLRDLPTRVFRLEAHAALRLSDGERRPLASFRGEVVLAYAGIARPEGFFSLLRAHGLEVVPVAGADHEPPPLEALLRRRAQAIMMTEKDAVKAAPHGSDPRLWFVPVEARFASADARFLTADLETLVRAGERR